MTGRVIGPGGAIIKSIREKSGARIQVGNDVVPGTTEQTVSIWGGEEQVEAALTMIQTVIATAAAEGVSTKSVGGANVAAAPGKAAARVRAARTAPRTAPAATYWSAGAPPLRAGASSRGPRARASARRPGETTQTYS
eukprot:3845947-Prymnesium_polylepis.1